MRTKVLLTLFFLSTGITFALSFQDQTEVLKDIDKEMLEAIKTKNFEPFKIVKFLQVYEAKMAQLNQGRNPHDDTPCRNVEPNQVIVPDDFYMMYEEGPTHAEWGPHTIVEVYADGKYARKERRFSREDREDMTKIISEGRMSAEGVKRIYATVIGCGFFDMEKAYWNRDVRDGKRELIRVVADGRTHSVVVYYYDVKRFNSLRGSLEGEVFKATKK